MPFDKPISTHTERLHVKLTQEDLSTAGQRLAQLEGDWAQHCQYMKSEQSKMASRKKELEAQVQQVAATIRDKSELRDVQVKVVLDAGEALEIRTDTNEVVRRRAIRPDEQQGKLFGDDKEEPELGVSPNDIGPDADDLAEEVDEDDQPEEPGDDKGNH